MSETPATTANTEPQAGKINLLGLSAEKLADFFAFGSDFRTDACMRILGKRRMANLVRCKRIFP